MKLQSEIDKVGWDAAKVYDTLVTDEKGYACSKELQYGTYLVKETKVPHNLYKTDDFTVEVTEDSRTPQRYRILNDATRSVFPVLRSRSGIQIPMSMWNRRLERIK